MKPLNRLLRGIEADPLDFAPLLLRVQESPPRPLGRKVLWAIFMLVGSLILWGFLGRLDVVAVAEGKLVPQSYIKIVQPSESGIVKEILVAEGEAAKAGQVLMRMDALISEAEVNALEAEFARKRLALRRIDAELSGAAFTLLPGDPQALLAEVAAQHRANRAALDAALAEGRSRLQKARQDQSAAEQVGVKLMRTLPYYIDQEKAFGKLAQNGFAGPLMVGDKERERIEREQEFKTQEHVIESARAGVRQSEMTLTQIESDYRRQLHAERGEAAQAIERLTQEISKQDHRRALLELRAPQDGVVKDLATHTVGTVVQPGTVLLTLVPQGETLRAEVWVSNEDIGFIKAGQTVKLKFAAFPFQKYGMAEGKVELVSADAADLAAANNGAPATDRSGKPTPLVYKTLVTLKGMTLDIDGARHALSAGMQANAEIRLGTRTVAQYLLSPVQKAWHEAGRER